MIFQQVKHFKFLEASSNKMKAVEKVRSVSENNMQCTNNVHVSIFIYLMQGSSVSGPSPLNFIVESIGSLCINLWDSCVVRTFDNIVKTRSQALKMEWTAV